MMLESSLGKILATKPVEPSISKEDAVAPATKSEAEVRIVFRFFVEEQIVFNGKIEKVKQLESEELSRIVSRIAWDGAKDEKKPLLDNEIIKNDKIVDCHQHDSERGDHSESTDKTQSADGMSMSSTVNSAGQDGGSKRAVDMECSSLYVNEKSSEVIFPDRGASTSSFQSPSPIVSNSDLHSDNHTTAPISKHPSEADTQLDGSYRVDRVERLEHSDDHDGYAKQEPVINTTSSDAQRREIEPSDAAAKAAAAAESQMITEALYDCVYNVDLESRRSVQESNMDIECSASEVTSDTIEDGYTNASGCEHVEQPSDTSRASAKLDKKPLMEAANVPSNNDTTQVTITSSDESFYKEKDAHTHQACKDDLNLRLESNKKAEMSMTSRRRNTSDNATASRRVRRSGSKDQRTPKISSLDSLGDGSIEKQVSERNRETTQAGENLARQSKVFAKWSDNHFYPGTISKAKDRKYEIVFFDSARKDVAEADLIPLSNIINKQVRVSIAKDYCANAQVHEKIIGNNGQIMFDVEYQQNGLVKKIVPLRDIFLTAEQGIPLINQPMRPDKNPDESMFAGVDLDNIVHVKRSRRLQEMEDLEMAEDATAQASNNLNGSRRKRGQYNMRNTTNRARASTTKPEGTSERGLKRLHSDVNNQDTPASSCSPDNLKPHLHSSNSNPPSESSSSTGSSNSASNVHEMGQEFYFESSSPHRTKTSLLL